ncbi:hypothetical protein [Colwellia sp. TT2012]|uniref:hypothetical protein n=1 Tax=Colwellia sp. TT2012 TaxID=1720342 RepID=UPI00070FA9B8|nr:hypothetical protein [Colwellia sp. TT2012]
MFSGRMERILLGTAIPPILGGLLYCVLMLLTSFKVGSIVLIPFIILGFIVLAGIPSLLYSLLMEFAIQKINNDKLVICISIVLSGFIGRVLGEIYWDPSIMSLIGGLIGLMVGYYLRWHIRGKPANKLFKRDK